MRKGANNTLDILAPKRDKEMANKLIKPCLMKLRKGDMSNDFCNNKQVHSAIIPSLYYEQHREWDDYVYKGIYGLKEISLRYDVPFSLLIARLKKGLSLHEAVTYKKRKKQAPI
ncbi:hypothetical protein [Aliivibrio salmonicida]|uniref:hypothetical protein n=1 Tax=Aliivibrio salmonicida TaxID=40269 RepID=UPI003D0EDF21